MSHAFEGVITRFGPGGRKGSSVATETNTTHLPPRRGLKISTGCPRLAGNPPFRLQSMFRQSIVGGTVCTWNHRRGTTVPELTRATSWLAELDISVSWHGGEASDCPSSILFYFGLRLWKRKAGKERLAEWDWEKIIEAQIWSRMGFWTRSFIEKTIWTRSMR